MTKKIKSLMLALVVTTTMSAMAGSAQAGTLHIAANPAVITGHSDPKAGGGFQQFIYSIGAGFNAICDTASFEGTKEQIAGPQTQTVHHLTITPTYQSCKLAGTAGTFQTHGCEYRLTGTAPSGALTFNVDIVCPTGKPMTVKTALCTIDFPAQNNLSHIVFKNESGNHLTMETTLSGMTSTQTGAACPNGNNFQTHNASFSGNLTVTAFKDKEENHLVTKTGHQALEYTHLGPSVELIAT
jgi:hypothetical protein